MLILIIIGTILIAFIFYKILDKKKSSNKSLNSNGVGANEDPSKPNVIDRKNN